MMNRRSLITGIAAFVAAPSIVRAGSLMPIIGDRYSVWQWRSPMLPDIREVYDPTYIAQFFGPNGRPFEGTWTFFGKTHNIWSDECVGFSKREYPA